MILGEKLSHLYPEASDVQNYFLAAKNIRFDKNNDTFGLKGIITERNINSNNTYHYYFRLDHMAQEFGPFTSQTNLDLGERVTINFPEKLSSLQMIDD